IIYAVQASETQHAYEENLSRLRNCSENAWQYVVDIGPEHWCLHTSVGVRLLYGWRTTNFDEAENIAAAPIRHQAPLLFFYQYVERLVTQSYKRSERCRRWIAEGRTLIAHAYKCLAQQQRDSCSLCVLLASQDEGYVWRATTPLIRFYVKVLKRSCSCIYFDQHRMACTHTIALMAHFGEHVPAAMLFGMYYTVEAYSALYKVDPPACIPLLQSLTRTPLLPPPVLARSGVQRRKRIPSRGERGGGGKKKRGGAQSRHGFLYTDEEQVHTSLSTCCNS
ncbi:hypothetical protein PybrP1_010037, partial [[Pythium] brassicae (nom. inval.)]